MGWWLPLVAFAAMAAQDILGSIMMQAESQFRAHLAAVMDTAQDVCWIASYGALGTALFSGRDLPLTAAVIACRLTADYSATWGGTKIGERIMRRSPRPAPCCPHCTGGRP